MSKHILTLSVGLLALLALLPGCTVYQAADRVEAPIEPPARFAGDRGDGTVDVEAAGNRWWKHLSDAALDGWIERVLTQNLDLAGAFARLAQSRAAIAASNAGAKPTVSAGLNPSANYSGTFEGGRVGGTTNIPLTVSLDQELDLWGKYRHQRTAAEFDAAAARFDVEVAAQRVVAEVVTAWLDRAEQLALRELVSEQIATTEKLKRVVELRFGQGQSTASDVLQQRQQVAALRAQLAPLEGNIAVSEHRLAILAGQVPGTAIPGRTAQLPEPPALPALGLPGNLLRRRPDIRAAERRVAAADHRVGAAIADRYPSFRFGLSLGIGAETLTNFFEQWIVNMSAALTAPILDGGRRSAEVDRTRARTQELLTLYARAVLDALGEVEDAAARERAQRAYLKELDEQLRIAQLSLETSEASFREGQADFLTVLSAQRTLLDTQQARLSAQRQLLSFRTALYRALGGRWSRALDAPKPLKLKSAAPDSGADVPNPTGSDVTTPDIQPESPRGSEENR